MFDFVPNDPKTVLPFLFFSGFLDSELDPQVLLTSKDTRRAVSDRSFRAKRWEEVLAVVVKKGYVDGLQLRAVNKFMFSLGGYLMRGFEEHKLRVGILGKHWFQYMLGRIDDEPDHSKRLELLARIRSYRWVVRQSPEHFRHLVGWSVQYPRSGVTPVVKILFDMAKLPLRHRVCDIEWFAATYFQTKSMAQLLMEQGGDINAVDELGNTFFHNWLLFERESLRGVPECSSQMAICEFLIEHKANPFLANQDGQTPAQIAKDKNIRYVGAVTSKYNQAS